MNTGLTDIPKQRATSLSASWDVLNLGDASGFAHLEWIDPQAPPGEKLLAVGPTFEIPAGERVPLDIDWLIPEDFRLDAVDPGLHLALVKDDGTVIREFVVIVNFA